jgi:hypothetical protein
VSNSHSYFGLVALFKRTQCIIEKAYNAVKDDHFIPVSEMGDKGYPTNYKTLSIVNETDRYILYLQIAE